VNSFIRTRSAAGILGREVVAAGSYALTFGPWIDDVRRTSGMDPVITERSMSQQDTKQ